MNKRTPIVHSRTDRWTLRGVALLIAVVLWITVLGGKKVEITKKVSLDYQLAGELTISNQVPREVTFRISGPRAFMREYQDRNLNLPVDLKTAKVGETEVVLREEMLDLPLGLRVTAISQPVFPVRIDRLAVKRVPVRPSFASTLPGDFKITSVSLKPSTIEIKGAHSRIQMIESLSTEPITVLSGSLKQEISANVALGDLPGVQISDSDKNISVTVELEGNMARKWFRLLPIGVRVGSGSQAKSLSVEGLGIKVRPARVSFLLEGPEKIIKELDNNQIEVWAELSKLQGGRFSSRIVWRLSPEIRVVKRSADAVEVVVPPL